MTLTTDTGLGLCEDVFAERERAGRLRRLEVKTPPRRGERWLVAVTMLIVAVAYSLNLAGWPRYFDDEGTYYSQAWAVQHLGALAPYTYWYDHPPVGWLQLSAFTWLPDLFIDGNSALLSGRIVIVGYMMVSAGLLYALARRVGLAVPLAFLATLLWALNPLVMYEGRQVFLDNVALPWLLGAFLLALNPARNLGLHMAAGFCFAVAVLSKETTLIFVIPLLLAIWQTAYKPTRWFGVVGFTAVMSGVGAMHLLFALIRNELFPGPGHVSLWDALAFQFLNRESSGFLLDPQGPEGGAYATYSNWLAQDPWLLYAGVLAGVLALGVRRLRPLGLAVVVATLVALRPGGYLPQMYVITVLPLAAVALVGLLDWGWRGTAAAMDGVAQRGKALLYASAFFVLVAAFLGTIPLQTWQDRYQTALTADLNDVQSDALRVIDQLPEDAVLAVDNTMWNDVVDQGREPEDVVWFYKVDSDGAVLEQLDNTYRSLDYLVWTTYMRDNAGPLVEQALQHTDLLWSQGEGLQRIEIRRVLSVDEERAREAAAAAKVAADIARSKADFEVFLTQPSTYPGLTNAQVEGIKGDAAKPVGEIARDYATTEARVRAILSMK